MDRFTDKFTYLKGQNAEYIEELYQRYLADPESPSIDPTWKYFFEGVQLALKSRIAPARPITKGVSKPQAPVPVPVQVQVQVQVKDIEAEAGVGSLIQAYRELGLHIADINPLELPLESHPLLLLPNFGLSEADLDRKFTAAKLVGFSAPATLREILARLRETYCGPIGVEFTHIEDPFAREWLRERLETIAGRPDLTSETKKHILKKLTETEAFERFLHTRYVAQKRFSIEGGDVLVPMLDCLIDETAERGAAELVLGMAHRGRLNVLANIFGKKTEYIFSEFEGSYTPDVPASAPGEGDVKYHLGWNSQFTTRHGKNVALTLAFNPSHLEFVNPVVEGMAYAEQSLLSRRGVSDFDAEQLVVPVLIHGDAAFAGQGIVYETMQLSAIRGYSTGGTVHIVVNNQIGFTATPEETRSTSFATDLGKMLETPILHVNGDDAEAAVFVAQVAAEYRQTFHKDIVIELVCYRKYGHNEGDEPSFTQPLMYQQIKQHFSPRDLYGRKLVERGVVSQSDVEGLVQHETDRLTASQTEARAGKKAPRAFVFDGAWQGLRRAATDQEMQLPVVTRVEESVLKEIGRKLSQLPQDFHVHPKLQRLLAQRSKQVEDGVGIDWGTGEALAFGSLVWQGIPVRLSGQDSQRGTFSHRHSVLYDYETAAKYVPLNGLREGQAQYSVYNSALSEAGVLGFDWGFSIVDPGTLTLWEAQFGDFANGAQVIVDQFISSAETKWQRMSGLVLLLPHGFEGQGPEHSSARLERYLQLCAQNNMQVCNLTTPAQLFHVLRRQQLRDFRKPLVIMTPKSLLRHPAAVSTLDEFSQGAFAEVIDDRKVLKNARRVIFCSGKVYYDLVSERDARGVRDVAVVRIEQLYPWPRFQVRQLLTLYSAAREVVWVQEEPRNQGAWLTVQDNLSPDLRDRDLFYVGRLAAAAPAVGSHKVHERQQRNLIEEALKEEKLK